MVVIPSGLRVAVLKQDHFAFNEFDALTTVLMGHGRLYAVMQEKDALYAKPDFDEADGMRAAEINFDQAEAPLISEADGALPLIEQTIDQAAVAVMAEALGIMAVINDLTLEYLKTREQFGQPIGKFQALQHRMVDMVIAAEESRSLVMVAAMQADGEANVRARAVSAAKVQIARAGRLIGQEAVQLHGAIAMTDDYQLGHYFKRLPMIGQLFGDSDHHLRRFAQLNG